MVYNVADENSFKALYSMYAKMCIHRAMGSLPIFLVASRDGVTDTTPRLIVEAKGRKMAQELKGCCYTEVKAQFAYNVEALFNAGGWFGGKMAW